MNDVERALDALAAAGYRNDQYGAFYVTPPGQHDKRPIGGEAVHDAGAAAGAGVGGTGGIALGTVAMAAFPVAGLAALFAGAGLGAYVGSLMGAMSQTRHVEPEEGNTEHPVEQPGGVRIAVNVEEGDAERALQALRSADAEDIAHAEGIWRDGDWEDFDPRVPATEFA